MQKNRYLLRWLGGLLALLLILGLAAAAGAAPAKTSRFKPGDALPGQIIVKYKPGQESGGKAFAQSLGLQEMKKSVTGARLLQLRAGGSSADVLKRLKADPRVAWAEPNYIYFASQSVNEDIYQDTFIDQQWNLQSIKAQNGWKVLPADTSENVTVAVVDSGVDASHPDLAGRILEGKNLALYKENGEQYSDDQQTGDFDDCGHGTHVAGIIAATYGNGLGIAGVAGPGSLSVLPVKVLNDFGWGSVFDTAQGIRYAADQGADVINLSLGGPYSNTLAEAVAYAQNKGALVVAAAGNENASVDTVYPAAYPGVLAVGAVNAADNRASFSNYGRALDLMAPGDEILSTVPAWLGEEDSSTWIVVHEEGAYYEYWKGTSMAAPHVAAAAALYKLCYPEASAVEIADVLEKTAKDLEIPGRDDMTGYGLLDLEKALTTPPGETASPELGFVNPLVNSQVTGRVALTVQVTRPEQVQRVDFFLDGQAEENKLAAVQQASPGQVNYTYTWDSSKGPNGAPLADGQHTLYARAFGQIDYLGKAAALPITVHNQVYTGLLLQVLDPTAAPAPGAVVYVLRREVFREKEYYPNYDNGQQEKVYYRVIMTGTTDSNGRLRIPGTLATDLKEYEVLVKGSFDRQAQDYAFVYRRHYAAPCSDVIDGSRAVAVQLQALDKNGDILPYTLFSAAPLDEKGQRIFTVGPLLAVLEQGSKAVAYLDKGAYDLFAFWHPREATEIARLYGQTKDYTGPTYFLTLNSVQVDAASNVTLDSMETGQLKVQVPDVQSGDRGGIYLLSQDDSAALGWDMELRGEELIVSAGEYRLGGWLEQSSADSRWYYDLEKDDPITVSAGSSQQIALGGGLTCQFQSVTENVYIDRNSFNASYKFADAGGNRLTWIYRDEKVDYDNNSSAYGGLYLKQLAAGETPRLWQWQPGQNGWQEKVVSQNNYEIIWPQYSIYDSNDQLVTSGSSWWGLYWWPSSNQPAGRYRAEVRLDNPGPIAGDQSSVMDSVYFNLLDQTQPGNVEITITGRDGRPAQNAELRILRRYAYTYRDKDNQEKQAAYWSWIYSAYADNNGQVQLPAGLSLDPNGHNLAVVEHSVGGYVYGENGYVDSGYTVLASFPFTSLQELAESGLSLENTVPVHMAVYDRQGLVCQSYDRYVAILSDLDGKLTSPEFVTLYYLYNNGSLYLQPGIYHLGAWFWGQNSEVYSLNQKDVRVESSPVRLTLDGRQTAKVQFNLTGNFDDKSAGLVSEDMPIYLSSNAAVNYVSPGSYTAYAYFTRRDPENSSHWWHYDLENDRETVQLAVDEERSFSFGGKFTADLQLAKNTLTRGDRLTGTSGIFDSFKNRLTNLWISTPYWYDYMRQAARPGEGVRCAHDGPVLWRTADGRLHLLGGDKYTAQSESVAPFLRIYRMQGESEERVFNNQSWQYFWDFDEDPAQWNALPGHYRAELAMGVGPEGPIMTGQEEKYLFTIAGELAQPLLDSPRSGDYLGSSTFTVSGLADPNATVQIYVYNGAQAGTMPQATVRANQDGKFSQSITVDADGAWKIFVRQEGKDTPSDTVTVYVDTTPPARPELQAELINNNRAVKLTWDSGQSGETDGVSTIIERNGSKLAELNPGTDFYVDSSVQAEKAYTYRIDWVDKAGNQSQYSEAVTITVPLQVTLQEAAARASLSPWGYTVLDSSLAITARGTSGQQAKAVLTLQKAAGEEQQTLALTEQGSGLYSGSFTMTSGLLGVKGVKVQLVNKEGQVLAEKEALSAPLYVGGSVPGTVKRGDKPAAGLTVTITGQGTAPGSTGSTYVYQSTTSKADGTFRFAGLPPGSYTVAVYDSAGNAPVEQKVTVQAGAVAGEVALVLQTVRTLTVTVQDQNDANKKLSGTWVVLNSQTTSLWQQTDRSGKAVFTGLSTGQYNWSTYGARWQIEAYEDASGTLTVEQEETAYTISLVSLRSKTGSLQGTVTDSNGQPVKDATVSAWSGSAPGWGSATTNDQGQYEIKYLPPADDYQVTFAHPDYKQVTLTGQSIETNKTITLDQQLSIGATVSGYVYGSGSPLINATVLAYSSADQYAYARTDGSGRYQLRGLDAGTWTITVYGQPLGYTNDNAEVNINQDGASLVRDFNLSELGSIEGTVRDTAGKPLKYIYLSAQKDGHYAGGTRTDEKGYYVIRGLADGTYSVTTSNWYGYQDETKDRVSVSAGVRAKADFTLHTREELAQAFGGAGNSFAASAEQAAPGERLTYKATYKNGLQSAVQNVQVQLDVPRNTSLVPGSIVVNGTAQKDDAYSNGTITINLGEVAAGASGTITYQVQVAGELNQETALLAKAHIKWTASGQKQEKPLGIASTEVVFTTINAPGLTADGQIKVYGKSLPGALVSVYDGSRLLGTTSVSGRWWSLSVKLPAPGAGVEEETHILFAQATLNGRASNLSEPATVVYRADIPVIEDAVIHAGWNGDVRANPYTGVITLGLTEKQSIDVRVKFQDNSVVQSVYFTWLDDTYSMYKDDDYFRGSVPYGWTTYGEQLLGLCFQDGTDRWYSFPLALITVLIDPSGYVYEGVPSNRLPGVTAVVQQKQGDKWVDWNAAAYGQVNPQLTDEQGRYGWDVPAGTWRVVFSKDGYETFTSDSIWDGQVPPPKTDLHVNLKSTATPLVTAVSPQQSAADVPVNSTVSITFSKYMQLSSFSSGTTFTVQRQDSGEKVSGSISGVNEEDGLARTIVFTPATALAPGTTYLVTVSKDVQDYTGRSPTADTRWSFTTAAGSSGGGTPGGSGGSSGGGGGGGATTTTTTTPAAPVTQTVSAASGGTVATADGAASLTLPAGALSADGQLKLAPVAPESAPATGSLQAGSPVYDITLEGAKLTKPVSLTLKYDRAKLGSVAAEKIGLYYWHETRGKWTYLGGSVDPVAGTVTAQVEHFTKFAVLANPALPVLQDIRNHWAYQDIKRLVGLEVVGGYPDATYRPENQVTRAEFAKLVVQAMGWTASDTALAFADRSAIPTWARGYVATAVQKGLIKGYADNTFRAEQAISRAEIATMLMRALGLSRQGSALTFADAALIPAWAREHVAAAVELGIIKGQPGNRFMPAASATRAETATMLARLLKTLGI